MQRVPLDRTLADRVQDFDCGDTPHAREVTDFVSGKTGEVWQAIDHLGLLAWLYLTDDDEDVIGFGSLVKQEVRLEGASQSLGSLLVIAYFGLQIKYHRKPGDDYKQFYARQIFRDLVAEARKHPSGLRRLALYVSPANVGAIRLYADPEFGFCKEGTFDGDDCMITDL